MYFREFCDKIFKLFMEMSILLLTLSNVYLLYLNCDKITNGNFLESNTNNIRNISNFTEISIRLLCAYA